MLQLAGIILLFIVTPTAFVWTITRKFPITLYPEKYVIQEVKLEVVDLPGTWNDVLVHVNTRDASDKPFLFTLRGAYWFLSPDALKEGDTITLLWGGLQEHLKVKK